MSSTIHNGRITGPVAYVASSGVTEDIPLGPCLIEQLDGTSVDVIWGARGEFSAALGAEAIRAAHASGRLVLLD